ncbi:MAG: hypothetical protein GXY52_01410 [Chloroflexi bacterium]|nr:hypothetical protein [Chloroflexota bacterium]
MTRTKAILLLIALVVLTAGCSMILPKPELTPTAVRPVKPTAVTNPFVGYWQVEEISSEEGTLSADEMAELGMPVMVLDVRDDQTAYALADDGSSEQATWEQVNATTWTLMTSSGDLEARLHGNQLELFDDNDGSTTLLVRIAKLPFEADSGDTAPRPTAGDGERWNGLWYGFIATRPADSYLDSDERIFDVFVVIEINGLPTDRMLVYRENANEPFIEAYVKGDDEHLEVEEGMLWDMPINPKFWYLMPLPTNEDNRLVVFDTYIDPTDDTNQIDLFLYLRPFGEVWSEEIEDDEYLPPSYDLYTDALAEGYLTLEGPPFTLK